MEVFSAQGRNPVSRWKLSGPVRKEFDRLVKGYVYTMEGGSSTTRMQLPDKGSCEYLLPFPTRVLSLPSILYRGTHSSLQWAYYNATLYCKCWCLLMQDLPSI